jgi:hypothetical protein
LTFACEKFHAVKIQRYVQLYQSPEMKKKVQELGMEVKLSIHAYSKYLLTSQLLNYDACSQIWVRNWDDWVEFASSPEYVAALMPDADHFMDYKKSGIKVMAG